MRCQGFFSLCSPCSGINCVTLLSCYVSTWVLICGNYAFTTSTWTTESSTQSLKEKTWIRYNLFALSEAESSSYVRDVDFTLFSSAQVKFTKWDFSHNTEKDNYQHREKRYDMVIRCKLTLQEKTKKKPSRKIYSE